MVEKDSDDKIQKITKLLEKGGTMLATHHECGAPMFRYQGKIVCPVCDFQEEKQKNEPQETGKTEKPQIGHKKADQNRIVRAEPLSFDTSAINNMIINKVRELAISLETEADLGRTRDKMECIEQGLKILKLLQD
ncbi:MAG TPA: Sjogren's syndrome/scleroderma autoantigen 1 family protein [Candidatus Methanoperedens sp.]|nr:Sjogren's syndrome/scleroderma autoantigen 1 family protein [Candidatus Methanoperedens sp.]